MDVIANGLEIPVARAIDEQRLIATGKEVTKQFVPPVESVGVGAQKPFHARDQIRLRRLDDQVKMIRHQDIGKDLPTGLGARLGQRQDEAIAIRIVEENRLTTVAPIHNVVDRTRILDS